MARYWIADLHLGHEKVAKLRGFASYQEHDEHIQNQLERVGSDDELWVLGDISSGRPEKEDYALWYLRFLANELGVKMHLIAGNHDSVSSIHRNGYKKQREWLELFESIQQFGRMRLNGMDVLMSHYPYARSGDGANREGARYLEYRLPDSGLPLIHGHTHQSEPHMVKSRMVLNNRGDVRAAPDLSQFCVSWDAHRRLVTEHDLNQWLDKLK